MGSDRCPGQSPPAICTRVLTYPIRGFKGALLTKVTSTTSDLNMAICSLSPKRFCSSLQSNPSHVPYSPKPGIRTEGGKYRVDLGVSIWVPTRMLHSSWSRFAHRSVNFSTLWGL